MKHSSAILQDGSTMLMEAAKGGHFDIMNLLLDWPTSGDRSTSAGGQTSSQSGIAEPTSKVSQ
jgi:hypothetical protein